LNPETKYALWGAVVAFTIAGIALLILGLTSGDADTWHGPQDPVDDPQEEGDLDPVVVVEDLVDELIPVDEEEGEPGDGPQKEPLVLLEDPDDTLGDFLSDLPINQNLPKKGQDGGA
jgi:hypothetical protein